jgi:hypothetical protein
VVSDDCGWLVSVDAVVSCDESLESVVDSGMHTIQTVSPLWASGVAS